MHDIFHSHRTTFVDLPLSDRGNLRSFLEVLARRFGSVSFHIAVNKRR
jgi:hypothetical protein